MEHSKLKIEVQSEIGRLNAVLLHRPGAEVENMTPRNVQRALYSDILNLSIAQNEYEQLSGVLSKAFQESPYEKTSEAGYSVLSAAVTVVISGIILLAVKNKLKKPAKGSLALIAGYGIFNKVANYLLLLSLANLPASTQYPMVTGGVMIVSTVLGCFTDKKPSKKEFVSVALSFLGIAALIMF